MSTKDPLNNMDPLAPRVVHIRHTDSMYRCGRRVLAVMWGSSDIAAGRLPSCLQCLGATWFMEGSYGFPSRDGI